MVDDLERQRQRAFERAGLGGGVTRGRRPGVVVVDLQRGFTDPEHPLGADCTSVIDATNRLLDAAHAADVPVHLSVIAYEPGERTAWFDKMPQLHTLTVGSGADRLDDRLAVRATDRVHVKRAPSAAFETDLVAELREQGVDTAIVTGATTSGCVRATVVDLVSSGFPVLVPRDAVGDRATGPHDAALIDIEAKYGDVIETEAALTYLHEVASAAAPPT